ncbi:MAG TPA: hypothetical protein ENJ11_09900 [Gammaproteobacteria bacterium]|nr:hypothetical protein [Gammaproteobacteria bacterium]
MPLLEISTNIDIVESTDLAKQASQLAAEILGKPESYVMVKIMPGQTLLFAGSTDPAAHIKLKSLGLPEERTGEFSEKLCSFIEDQLDIPSARIYIEFAGPDRHMWGWDKRTF